MTTECPLCGGLAVRHVEQIDSEYRGVVESVPIHYKSCSNCLSEFADEEDGTLNKNAILEFRQRVELNLTK
jgi:hypothetical protein